jgi:hypothetical protein
MSTEKYTSKSPQNTRFLLACGAVLLFLILLSAAMWASTGFEMPQHVTYAEQMAPAVQEINNAFIDLNSDGPVDYLIDGHIILNDNDGITSVNPQP